MRQISPFLKGLHETNKMTFISLRLFHFKEYQSQEKKLIQDMIENFQKMRNFLITKIRNFDSFSFRDVSDSFVPRVMRDGVDTLGRARPVCTEALIFI